MRKNIILPIFWGKASFITAILSIFACFGPILAGLSQPETPKYTTQEGLLPKFFADTKQ